MISIITPVYNGVQYIDTCIKSVVAQSCPYVEHLIIDGKSNDGTVEIVSIYAQENSHIRWISEEDIGQSDAMNKGIAMAWGDIIGFLNVDDYYEPHVLQRVAGIFKTLPDPSLLVGNCNVVNRDGTLQYINKPKNLDLTHLLLGPVLNPHPINPSAYFYHKSLHEEIGLYNVDEHYALDLDFILRAVQVANVKYIDVTWGNFVMVEGSKTYVDSRRSQGFLRYKNVLKSYWKDLPFTRRYLVAFVYTLIQLPIIFQIVYFIKHPKEFLWRLKAKLAKFTDSF